MDQHDPVTLTPACERYILHWGEMGPQWGVNRTVAQAHALLYLSDVPLHADQIAATLGVARSNVSTSLRELKDWGLIQTAPVLGQRKEHFTTDRDPWNGMLQVLDERMRRELLPTLEVVRACAEEARAGKDSESSTRRMEELADLLEAFTGFYGAMRKLPKAALKKLLKGGGRTLGKLTR